MHIQSKKEERMETITRRDLVKGASLAAVGAAVASVAIPATRYLRVIPHTPASSTCPVS